MVDPLVVPAQNQTEQKSQSLSPYSHTPLMFPASPPHISPQASPRSTPVSPHPSTTFSQPHTEYSPPKLTSYDNSPLPFTGLAGDSTTAHSLNVTNVNSEDGVPGIQSPSSTQQVSSTVSLPRLFPASSSYSVTCNPDPIHDDSASPDENGTTDASSPVTR